MSDNLLQWLVLQEVLKDRQREIERDRLAKLAISDEVPVLVRILGRFRQKVGAAHRVLVRPAAPPG